MNVLLHHAEGLDVHGKRLGFYSRKLELCSRKLVFYKGRTIK